jgi:hypothetical protein
MTRLEKVITEKKEELKKLLLEDYCPSDFLIEDRHDGSEKYCDPAIRNCEACWNEETENIPACEGCGIPAEYCEPETCQIAQTKEKAADVVETAEEYILITF